MRLNKSFKYVAACCTFASCIGAIWLVVRAAEGGNQANGAVLKLFRTDMGDNQPARTAACAIEGRTVTYQATLTCDGASLNESISIMTDRGQTGVNSLAVSSSSPDITTISAEVTLSNGTRLTTEATLISLVVNFDTSILNIAAGFTNTVNATVVPPDGRLFVAFSVAPESVAALNPITTVTNPQDLEILGGSKGRAKLDAKIPGNVGATGSEVCATASIVVVDPLILDPSPTALCVGETKKITAFKRIDGQLVKHEKTKWSTIGSSLKIVGTDIGSEVVVLGKMGSASEAAKTLAAEDLNSPGAKTKASVTVIKLEASPSEIPQIMINQSIEVRLTSVPSGRSVVLDWDQGLFDVLGHSINDEITTPATVTLRGSECGKGSLRVRDKDHSECALDVNVEVVAYIVTSISPFPHVCRTHNSADRTAILTVGTPAEVSGKVDVFVRYQPKDYSVFATPGGKVSPNGSTSVRVGDGDLANIEINAPNSVKKDAMIIFSLDRNGDMCRRDYPFEIKAFRVIGPENAIICPLEETTVSVMPCPGEKTTARVIYSSEVKLFQNGAEISPAGGQVMTGIPIVIQGWSKGRARIEFTEDESDPDPKSNVNREVDVTLVAQLSASTSMETVSSKSSVANKELVTCIEENVALKVDWFKDVNPGEEKARFMVEPTNGVAPFSGTFEGGEIPVRFGEPGEFVVTAWCDGNNDNTPSDQEEPRRLKISVVEVDKVVAAKTKAESTVACVGEKIKIQALAAPIDKFPKGGPKWSIVKMPDGSAIQDPANGDSIVNITPDKVGVFVFRAECGASFDEFVLTVIDAIEVDPKAPMPNLCIGDRGIIVVKKCRADSTVAKVKVTWTPDEGEFLVNNGLQSGSIIDLDARLRIDAVKCTKGAIHFIPIDEQGAEQVDSERVVNFSIRNFELETDQPFPDLCVGDNVGIRVKSCAGGGNGVASVKVAWTPDNIARFVVHGVQNGDIVPLDAAFTVEAVDCLRAGRITLTPIDLLGNEDPNCTEDLDFSIKKYDVGALSKASICVGESATITLKPCGQNPEVVFIQYDDNNIDVTLNGNLLHFLDTFVLDRQTTLEIKGRGAGNSRIVFQPGNQDCEEVRDIFVTRIAKLNGLGENSQASSVTSTPPLSPNVLHLCLNKISSEPTPTYEASAQLSVEWFGGVPGKNAFYEIQPSLGVSIPKGRLSNSTITFSRPGKYTVTAWCDSNGNGILNNDEFFLALDIFACMAEMDVFIRNEFTDETRILNEEKEEVDPSLPIERERSITVGLRTEGHTPTSRVVLQKSGIGNFTLVKEIVDADGNSSSQDVMRADESEVVIDRDQFGHFPGGIDNVWIETLKVVPVMEGPASLAFIYKDAEFECKDIFKMDIMDMDLKFVTLDANGIVRLADVIEDQEEPFPTVQLNIKSSRLQDGASIKVSIEGSIKDDLSEVVDEGLQITELILSVNGEEVERIPVDYGPGSPPWKRRTLAFDFARELSLQAGVGSQIITLEATNAAGNRGFDSWGVPIHLVPNEDSPLLESGGDVTLEPEGGKMVLRFGDIVAGSLSPNAAGIHEGILSVAPNGQQTQLQDLAVAGERLIIVDHNFNVLHSTKLDGDNAIEIGSAGSGPKQFNMPLGIAVRPDGFRYVADAGNNRIQIFEADGSFFGQFGTAGSLNGQFSFPTDVAVDGAGNVFVVDGGNHRIQKFTATLQHELSWGGIGSGNGQFQGPNSIVIDSDGNVYVSDAGNHRIQKFTNAGVHIWSAGSQGNGPSNFSAPSGLALRGDQLLVVDSLNHRIQILAKDGTFNGESIGSQGSTGGKFDNPSGIAVDGQGNLYISDSGNYRVQKLNSVNVFVADWPVGQTVKASVNLGEDFVPNQPTVTTTLHLSRITSWSTSMQFGGDWELGGDGRYTCPTSIDDITTDHLGLKERIELGTATRAVQSPASEPFRVYIPRVRYKGTLPDSSFIIRLGSQTFQLKTMQVPGL